MQQQNNNKNSFLKPLVLIIFGKYNHSFFFFFFKFFIIDSFSISCQIPLLSPTCVHLMVEPFFNPLLQNKIKPYYLIAQRIKYKSIHIPKGPTWSISFPTSFFVPYSTCVPTTLIFSVQTLHILFRFRTSAWNTVSLIQARLFLTHSLKLRL